MLTLLQEQRHGGVEVLPPAESRNTDKFSLKTGSLYTFSYCQGYPHHQRRRLIGLWLSVARFHWIPGVRRYHPLARALGVGGLNKILRFSRVLARTFTIGIEKCKSILWIYRWKVEKCHDRILKILLYQPHGSCSNFGPISRRKIAWKDSTSST